MNLYLIDIIYYVSSYFFIGSLITLIIDSILRNSEPSDSFTFWEAATIILLWPIVLVLALINAIKRWDDL